MAEEDENIFDSTIWTNEVVFKPNGHVNRHNSIYWTSEDPKIDLKRELNVLDISV